MKTIIKKLYDFFSSSKIQTAAVCLVFLMLFIIGYIHATKGIDFWDDGFYIAAPMRYMFKDIPFVDEFATHIYSFDKIVAFVFFLFPKITLLQHRIIGILFNLLTLYFLYRLISIYSSKLLSVIVCAVIFLVNNFCFLASPSYNSLGSNFITLSFITFINSIFANKYSVLLAIISGIFLLLSTISYLGLVGMVLIPIFLVALSFIYCEKILLKIRKNAIILLLTYSLSLLLILMAMHFFQLLPVFIKGFIDQSSKRDIGAGLLMKKINDTYFWFISSAKNGIALFLIFAAVIFGITETVKIKTKKINWIYTAISVGFIIYFLPQTVPSDPSTIPFTLYVLVSITAIVIINYIRYKFGDKPAYMTFGCLTGLAVLFATTTNSQPSQLIINTIPYIAYGYIVFHLNIITAIVTGSVFVLKYFYNAHEILGILYLSSSFLVGSSIILFFFNKLFAKKNNDPSRWDIITKIGIIWFIMAGLLFSFSSFSGYARMIQGVAPLFAIIFISIYFIFDRYNKSVSSSVDSLRWKSVFLVVISVFLLNGYQYYVNYFNNELLSETNTPFSYWSLKGVKSTPRKVEIIEDLMKYLDGKVKFGDYFLTYYYDPLLYFITRTRPSYREVLAQEDYTPFSTRKQMVKDIIKKNKIPQYVVKFMVHQGHVFKDPVHFICEDNQQCPLDKFVIDNYYLEKALYPFEVWRYGSGPKLKLFNSKTALFTENFSNINEASISGTLLIQLAKPIELFSPTENIIVEKGYKQKLYDYISLKPINNIASFKFGYVSNKNNGLQLKFNPGDTVLFTLTAEISEKRKDYAAIRGLMSITEEDNKGLREKNDIAISIPNMYQYIISKKIRDPNNTFIFMIDWLPGSNEDWLNIKEIKIYREKSLSNPISMEKAVFVGEP